MYDLKVNEYGLSATAYSLIPLWSDAILENSVSLSLVRDTRWLPQTSFVGRLRALKSLHLDFQDCNRLNDYWYGATPGDNSSPLTLTDCRKAFGWLSNVQLERLTVLRSWFDQESRGAFKVSCKRSNPA